MAMTELPPVWRTIKVGIGPDAAFAIFTSRMADWWPLHSHGIFGEETAGVVVEPRVGGRVYEVAKDGREADFAIVTVWEPGSRVELAWKPNDRPVEPTSLDIRFIGEASGCRVELAHTGWERLGEEAGREARDSYEKGWIPTLDAFARAVP